MRFAFAPYNGTGRRDAYPHELARRFHFGQVLRGADETVPVLLDVFWRAADLGDVLGDVLGRHHFDRVPRADGQLVRVRLLLRNVDADFAADAALQVDLA